MKLVAVAQDGERYEGATLVLVSAHGKGGGPGPAAAVNQLMIYPLACTTAQVGSCMHATDDEYQSCVLFVL